MKTNKIFAAMVLGLAAVACTSGNAAASADGENVAPKEMTAKDYLPSKAVTDSVSYLLGINFGSFIKGYDFGEDFNYSEMVKGIKDFVNSKGNVRDEGFNEQFKINPESMNEAFNNYLENRHNYKLLVNKDKGAKFLAANKGKAGVVETESGLQYKIIEAGNDVKPGPKDTVSVKYCGKLLDGTVFDETPEDAEPVTLTLNRVISGWTEGLQLIGEGGEIELYIPSELGYGEQGNSAIEPNSTLIFNVKLDKVGKVVVDAE